MCAKIDPSEFVTDLNRRIFESLTAKIKENEDLSVAAFNAEFSPDEVGRIVGLLDKYKDLSVDEKVCSDYIEVLKKYHENSEKKDVTADNESFLKELERLRNKNNG